MIPRLFAATGAVLLWAYARACRERNATQRRLARANLLRRVAARPGRTDRSCDRPVTIDSTPDTSKLDSLRAWWSSPDDELPPPTSPARTGPTRDPFNIVKIAPAEAERLSAIHTRRLLDDLEQTVEALPTAEDDK